MKTTKTAFTTLRPLPMAVALASLASLALPAAAQNLVLEEVVVTAQKRTESLMDVPLSVSAVSGNSYCWFFDRRRLSKISQRTAVGPVGYPVPVGSNAYVFI